MTVVEHTGAASRLAFLLTYRAALIAAARAAWRV